MPKRHNVSIGEMTVANDLYRLVNGVNLLSPAQIAYLRPMLGAILAQVPEPRRTFCIELFDLIVAQRNT